jgi:DNA-binding NarL/FixJ family response regulator
MKSKIKVMLIEDHPEYRDLIETALNEQADMELCGKFGAAEIALRSLQDKSSQHLPDLILLDLHLPGMNGIESIPWITKYAPKTKVIILTRHNREAEILEAISSGASGYLLKGASIDQITEGIRIVMRGGASLDPTVAMLLLDKLSKKTSSPTSGINLTEREHEVLTLLSQGLIKKEMASKLGITTRTVDAHIAHVYEKLHVNNAPAAIDQAHRKGLL